MGTSTEAAQADQIDLRTAILTMLDYYAEVGIDVTRASGSGSRAAPTRSPQQPFAAVKKLRGALATHSG